MIQQAEGDDGDLSEMVSGVEAGLQLNTEQLQQSRERCLYVTEKAHTGDECFRHTTRNVSALHSTNEAGGRNMSGIRAGTGLPDQCQAGCAKCCGARSGISTAFP
jgi:hypothetical protein